ncbi:hypothetical protein TIFTF001_011762 [Ficus carica]|uniref:Uncharacterized protein n=1 Tax=Ficus carica TaxID=3494 RepID=A0AA88D358_FICCA|nr:hypothetical protein TIFTF001_011762 [Ficus carica]
MKKKKKGIHYKYFQPIDINGSSSQVLLTAVDRLPNRRSAANGGFNFHDLVGMATRLDGVGECFLVPIRVSKIVPILA